MLIQIIKEFVGAGQHGNYDEHIEECNERGHVSTYGEAASPADRLCVEPDESNDTCKQQGTPVSQREDHSLHRRLLKTEIDKSTIYDESQTDQSIDKMDELH